jgi:hypothetical protein
MKKIILFLFLLVILCSSVVYSVTPTLIYYTFDEDLNDSNSNATGKTTLYDYYNIEFIPGLLGNQLNLETTDDFVSNVTANGDILGLARSINFWLTIDEYPSPSKMLLVYGNRNTDDNIWMELLENGTLDMGMTNNGNPEWRQLVTQHQFPLNVTVMVSLTFGSNGMKFYINESLDSSSVSTAVPNSDYNSIIIGNERATNTGVNATFDNFAVLPFELSTDNITTFYNGGVPYNFSSNPINIKPIPNNVSITPLPLLVATDAIGHWNYTDEDGNAITDNETVWYVNKTKILTAINTTTLQGSNVTTTSNITFSVRVKDSEWSDWVNSSTVNVGDTTAPTIHNITLSSTSAYSDETVTISAYVTEDFSSIASVKVTINNNNFSMSSISGNFYSLSQTYGSGSYNLTSIYAIDGNGNIKTNNTDLSFTVTTRPSTSSDTSGGGGGESFDCDIELFMPKAGTPISIIGGTVGDLSNPALFTIRNSGTDEGEYKFEVLDNDYLIENCVFNSSREDIDANLKYTNGISCVIPSVGETGTIRISGCGKEGNYVLRVSQNFFLGLLSSLIRGESLVLFGYTISSATFIASLLVLIPLIIIMIVFGIGSTSSFFKWVFK